MRKKLHKKLIVHIGYPKTASTTMQVNFFGKLMKSNKVIGIAHLPGLTNYENGVEIHNCYNYIYTGKKNNSKIEEELKKIKKINQKISVFSSESLAWIAEDSKDHTRLPLLIYKNAERINELFKKYYNKIIILIVIRNQKELCPSLYKEILKVQKLPNYKIWIKKILTNKGIRNSFLNYNKQITTYQKLFGKENVKVLLYEDLIHDQDYFFKQLGKIFNVTKNFTKRNFLKKKLNINPYSFSMNFTLSDFVQKFLARHIENILPNKIYNILFKVYHLSLRRIFELIIFKKTPIDIRDQTKQIFVFNKFKQINKKLIKEGLTRNKLKKYNYI